MRKFIISISALIAASVLAWSQGLQIPPQALLNLANTWSQIQTFTLAPVFTDASGTRTAIGCGSLCTVTPGTGVATALGVNIGSAGAPVTNGGALGTPSSGIGTNLTGTASGFTAGNVTTNANLTGPITSVGNATSIASQTGTGTKFVVDTTPTLITPVLGAATATSINFGGSTFSTYTVGTWTPTFIGSSTAGTGQTYTIQVGSYEQIGRQVTARFYITASSLGTAAGNIQISGLPLTSSSTTNDYGTCSISYYAVSGLAALNYAPSGLINPNTAYVGLYASSSTTATAITIAQAGASAAFIGVCNYHV